MDGQSEGDERTPTFLTEDAQAGGRSISVRQLPIEYLQTVEARRGFLTNVLLGGCRHACTVVLHCDQDTAFAAADGNDDFAAWFVWLDAVVDRIFDEGLDRKRGG